MPSMEQQIDDLRRGKHKDWHLQAVKTKTYGDFGWDYIPAGDQYWEFVVGFDYEEDAYAAMADAERRVAEGEQYGADQFDFRVVKREGA